MKYTLLSVAAMATAFTATADDSRGPIYYSQSQPIWPWIVIISILAAALIVWIIYLLMRRRNANPVNVNTPVPIPAQPHVQAPAIQYVAVPTPAPVPQPTAVLPQTQPVAPAVQTGGTTTVFTINTATPIQVGPTTVTVTTP